MRGERMAGGSLVLSATLLFLAGCTDNSTSVVSGEVTVDGQPVDGSISFIPVDGKSRDAGGDITDGAYSVVVPVGTMKVVISMGEISGYKELYKDPKAPGPPPKQALMREVLPAKYSSREETELKVDVKPGGMQKDWPLTKK
jgi:hypothetical protein